MHTRPAIVALLLSTGLARSSQLGTPPGGNLSLLFSRIWQVTGGVSQPAPGTLYVFLPNGTLLESSCVETYRIATWSADTHVPTVLRVVEDRQPAFLATILELTNKTLRLRQELARTHEQRTLTLKSVTDEFVCPDLPK